MGSRVIMIFGAILVVFSLVWLYLIFPGMAKIPADYEQEYGFEGTVHVFNPALGALVPIQVDMTRFLEAERVTDDDVLLLRQNITFYEATSGAPLGTAVPGLDLDSSELYGVDRSTRANVSSEGDTSRSGQFTFPADVEQKTYQYWSSSVNKAVSATFVKEETYQGLDVYVFEINSTGNNYYPDASTGLSQTMDVSAMIKVEPVSGVPVFATTKTTINLQHPQAGPIPVFINENSYTSATVSELSDSAESTKNLILWASVYGFWIVLGLGVVLFVIGIITGRRS